jgi:exosortase
MATATISTSFPQRSRREIWSAAALALVLGLVYFGVVRDLFIDWWRSEDYSYGLLLPFALAYLIYEKRREIRALPVSPSLLGLVLIVGSQLINLVGFLGAEFFLQRTSLVVLLAGIILFVYGWAHLREAAFALTLMLLTIPLPALIFNQIALPLQLLASSISETVLQWLHIPVLREGNVLQMANMTMSVAEACSGIRSLMSMITLSVVIAYLLPLRWGWRSLFIASSVPIAIAANCFRVAGTGVLSHHYGQKAAEGFFHTFSGWLIFVVAFIALSAEAWLLLRLNQRGKAVTA